MGYLHTWVFEDTHVIPELGDTRNRACFAGLTHIPANAKYFTLWTYLFDDYSKAVLKSSRFTRIVNYWIHIGKLLGLKFDNLKWNRDANTNTIRFVLDITYLQKFKGNKHRMLWMHLFFLRLLTERQATVMMMRMYRKRLMKKYPYLSLLTTVIMCERHRFDLLPLYDFNKTGYYEYKRPIKQCSISPGQYSMGGHHFFQSMGNDRQLKACKIKSLYKAFLLEPKMPTFDTHLIRGEFDTMQVQGNIFQQAEKINAQAKAAGFRRYNIRKALPVRS